MGKNKKAEKAANLAAKTAAKTKETEKKVTETTVNNKVEEQKKANPPKKTEEPTAKPENEKPTTKQEKKPAEKKEKKDHVPTMIAEEVADDGKKALAKASKATGIPVNTIGNSAQANFNGKAMMAHVMQERYGRNEELRKNYPQLFEEMNRSIDVVVLLGLVDLRQDLLNRKESGELQFTIDVDQLLPLQTTANLLGIELGAAKALPGSDGSQLQLDFTEAKVPEELKADAGKSQQFAEVELDPNKINTPEALIAALNNRLTAEKNTGVNIVNAVSFYRDYLLTKEQNAEKKLEIDSRSVGELLKDIFSLTTATSLHKGLGRSLYLYASKTGSPCMSHAIMHKHMAPCGWTEEEIADAVKALIRESFRLRLKDDEKLDPKNDGAINALLANLGNEYIDNLLIDMNSDDDEKKTTSRMVCGTIRGNYFKKGNMPNDANLRLKIGQIINLYRDPSDRLAEYEEESTSLGKPSEYSTTNEKKN